MSEDFPTAFTRLAAEVNTALDRLIPASTAPEARVVAAMRYAVLDGGKRLRPFLVRAGADMFGVDPAFSMRVAAATEMVHCYSLVHDDLPAMDDDDLRRGRPTVHKQFDEATAILAGDALLTLAFETLAAPETHPYADTRVALVSALARAVGAAGMVGGQMIDLAAERRALAVEELEHLQALKTGRLLAFAAAASAILAADRAAAEALHAYGLDLGLAFQITDDLLDVEGTAATTGKATGKDAGAGKATFVSRLGVEGARKRARSLIERAQDRLAVFGPRAHLLRQAADFVLARKS
jgi:farnesyl diphosphate synthase